MMENNKSKIVRQDTGDVRFNPDTMRRYLMAQGGLIV